MFGISKIPKLSIKMRTYAVINFKRISTKIKSKLHANRIDSKTESVEILFLTQRSKNVSLFDESRRVVRYRGTERLLSSHVNCTVMKKQSIKTTQSMKQT